MSTADVCGYLGISRMTLYRYRAGKCLPEDVRFPAPFVITGHGSQLWRREDIEAFEKAMGEVAFDRLVALRKGAYNACTKRMLMRAKLSDADRENIARRLPTDGPIKLGLEYKVAPALIRRIGETFKGGGV